MISNNFTKRHQNGFKISMRQACDTFEVGKRNLNLELFHNFLQSVKLNFELGKPVADQACRMHSVTFTFVPSFPGIRFMAVTSRILYPNFSPSF